MRMKEQEPRLCFEIGKIEHEYELGMVELKEKRMEDVPKS
jgi:hypothetical protein